MKTETMKTGIPMNNLKKKYLKPEIAIIEMTQECSLLCESCEEKFGVTWDYSDEPTTPKEE